MAHHGPFLAFKATEFSLFRGAGFIFFTLMRILIWIQLPKRMRIRIRNPVFLIYRFLIPYGQCIAVKLAIVSIICSALTLISTIISYS
jgi:hypothetical protein